jgi:hypothetical protein
MSHYSSHHKHNALYQSLKKQSELTDKQFHDHHPHVRGILQSLGTSLENIRNRSIHIVTSGTLAASLFLSSPFLHHTVSGTALQISQLTQSAREHEFSQELLALLPKEIKQISVEDEQKVHELLQTYWGIHASALYQNQRLNHSYGYIGAEQHLPRYPGDVLGSDDMYKESGITPGIGAWGYFASSKQELTKEDIEREKYYVAVQTLYLPDWNTNTKVLKEWYKYRKVVVVNPENGKVIVCVIADAGPAKFTGKHFGGSPEVMGYLDLNKGMKKGAVLLFFLNESSNTVPLGPLEYHLKTGTPEKENEV